MFFPNKTYLLIQSTLGLELTQTKHLQLE